MEPLPTLDQIRSNFTNTLINRINSFDYQPLLPCHVFDLKCQRFMISYTELNRLQYLKLNHPTTTKPRPQFVLLGSGSAWLQALKPLNILSGQLGEHPWPIIHCGFPPGISRPPPSPDQGKRHWCRAGSASIFSFYFVIWPFGFVLSSAFLYTRCETFLGNRFGIYIGLCLLGTLSL